MDRFLIYHLPVLRCKASHLTLACAWILGLVTGFIFSVSAGDSLLPMMRAAVYGRVSISGLLSAIFLPLLLSALAVFISQPWLFVPIAFCKAFSFAFLALGLRAAFGSAGWLVQGLLMFSDILMLPVLWWYWLKVSGPSGKASLICTAAAVFAASGIGSLDFSVVSPFLVKIIS